MKGGLSPDLGLRQPGVVRATGTGTGSAMIMAVISLERARERGGGHRETEIQRNKETKKQRE